MKYRKDFVTNSSSSCYICAICGETVSGMDFSLYDCEMVECVNGHVICENETLSIPRDDLIAMMVNDYDADPDSLKDESDENLFYSMINDHENEIRYNMPECFCPICQFIEYADNDLARYLGKKYGVSREEIFAKVKQFNKRRKKLYDSEYITEVCSRFNLNPTEIVAGWKNEFGTYKKFMDYLNDKES